MQAGLQSQYMRGEAGGSGGAQDHFCLCGKFKVHLGFTRIYLTKEVKLQNLKAGKLTTENAQIPKLKTNL